MAKYLSKERQREIQVTMLLDGQNSTLCLYGPANDSLSTSDLKFGNDGCDNHVTNRNYEAFIGCFPGCNRTKSFWRPTLSHMDRTNYLGLPVQAGSGWYWLCGDTAYKTSPPSWQGAYAL